MSARAAERAGATVQPLTQIIRRDCFFTALPLMSTATAERAALLALLSARAAAASATSETAARKPALRILDSAGRKGMLSC